MNQFHKLNTAMAAASFVRGLSISVVDRESGKYDLELCLAENPTDFDFVRVVFRDVVELKCNLALGGWSQVEMLGVRSKREGYEQPYVVEEIEFDTLSFRCASAELAND